MPDYTPAALDLFKLTDPQREYRNLEDLYYREIDPVTELVQNSVVSIILLQSGEQFRGQVNIQIDGEAGELVVSDNGGGFESLEDIAANRSRRNIRTDTPESGFGLGLSSVLARSDYFSVDSVNSHQQRHFAEWARVRQRLHDPNVLTSLRPDSVGGPSRMTGDRITTVTVRGDGFSELWTLARENPTRLYSMMLAHTALGHTSWIWRQEDRPNIRFHVSIEGGAGSFNKRERLGFQVARPGSRATIDLETYLKTGRASTSSLLILSKEGRASSRRDHWYNLYVACEIERGKHIKRRFGEYVENLKTNRILLSVNGFLQSFPIERPAERQTRALWGNIMAIVDASVNVVEPGRNRINDRFVHEIEEELRNAISRLDRAAEKIRTKAQAERPIDIEDAKQQVTAAATARPLSFAIGQDIAFLKEPEEESEVVGLFCHLLGMGLLRGLRVVSIGGSRWVYDCYIKYAFKYRDVGEHTRPTRQEGGRRLNLERLREKILVAEFKLHAGQLATELLGGTSMKRMEQIDLLICWSEGSVPAAYLLDPLPQEDRFVSHATHRLLDQSAQLQCEVLVLSKFLEDLET